MNVGTKSLLFGVHQFVWHPITVLLAWIELYGFPNWKEIVCIIIHDIGYWGSPNMDGPEGEKHPEYGAYLAKSLLDKNDPPYMLTEEYWIYYYLCLYHSRYYANRNGDTPSKLCWADKLSCKFDPWWFYLPRAVLSGEIKEYRQREAEFGAVPLSASNRDWYKWAQPRMMGKAYRKDERPSYQEGS